MTDGLADEQNRVTTAHHNLYDAWSRGGAGVLMGGNIILDRRFLSKAGDPCIDMDYPHTHDTQQREMLKGWYPILFKNHAFCI